MLVTPIATATGGGEGEDSASTLQGLTNVDFPPGHPQDGVVYGFLYVAATGRFTFHVVDSVSITEIDGGTF
jgi:hypothetical protein